MDERPLKMGEEPTTSGAEVAGRWERKRWGEESRCDESEGLVDPALRAPEYFFLPALADPAALELLALPPLTEDADEPYSASSHFLFPPRLLSS